MSSGPLGNRCFIAEGSVIKERWKIARKLGGGGFGDVFEAVDLIINDKVAIKAESRLRARQLIRMEVTLLKALQGTKHVCVYYGSGRKDDYNYLVMSLLGKSIADLRRGIPERKFSLGTTVRILIQMLNGIESVHYIGFVHRDIKPANFAIGRTPEDNKVVYILDFGLARAHLMKSTIARPARPAAGFRGTLRYASLTVHKNRDVGRVDDLWSLFYVGVELFTGVLPWKAEKDKERVAKMKMTYGPKSLVKPLPKEFLSFVQHLQSLGYGDRPDYEYLRGLLFNVLRDRQISETDPFDWEIENCGQLQPSASKSSLAARDSQLKFKLLKPRTWLNKISLLSRSSPHAVAETGPCSQRLESNSHSLAQLN